MLSEIFERSQTAKYGPHLSFTQTSLTEWPKPRFSEAYDGITREEAKKTYNMRHSISPMFRRSSHMTKATL